MYYATEGVALQRWFIMIITSSMVSAEDYVINLTSVIKELDDEIAKVSIQPLVDNGLLNNAKQLLKDLEEISHLIDSAPQELINEYL